MASRHILHGLLLAVLVWTSTVEGQRAGRAGVNVSLVKPLDEVDRLVDFYDVIGTIKFGLSLETQWSEAFRTPLIGAIAQISDVPISRVSITSVLPQGNEYILASYQIVARLDVSPVEQAFSEQAGIASDLAVALGNGALRARLIGHGFPNCDQEVYVAPLINVQAGTFAIHRADLIAHASRQLTASAMEKVDSYRSADSHTRMELGIAHHTTMAYYQQIVEEEERLAAAIEQSTAQQSRLQLQQTLQEEAAAELSSEQQRLLLAFGEVQANADMATDRLSNDMDEALRISQQMAEVFTATDEFDPKAATTATTNDIMDAAQSVLAHVVVLQDNEKVYVEDVARIHAAHQNAIHEQLALVDTMKQMYQEQANRAVARTQALSERRAVVTGQRQLTQEKIDRDALVMDAASSLFVKEHETLMDAANKAFSVQEYTAALRLQLVQDAMTLK